MWLKTARIFLVAVIILGLLCSLAACGNRNDGMQNISPQASVPSYNAATGSEEEQKPSVECNINVRDMYEHLQAYVNPKGTIVNQEESECIRIPVKEGETWFIWYPMTANRYYNYTADSIGAVRFENERHAVVEYADLSKWPQYHFNAESVDAGPVVTIPSGASYMCVNLKMTTQYDFLENAVIMRVDKAFTGTWLSLGDSIAEFNTTANRNWLHLAADELSAKYYNLASSGFGYLAKGGYSKLFDRLPDDDNIRLVTIYGSFNDLCFDYEVGEVGDAYTEGANNSLAACMNNTYDQIRSKYPNAKIVVISPAPWGGFGPDGTRDSDVLAQQYVAVMKEICEMKGISFLDVFSECDLKPWIPEENQTYYHNEDACHPNDEGHKILSKIIIPYLEKILDEA